MIFFKSTTRTGLICLAVVAQAALVTALLVTTPPASAQSAAIVDYEDPLYGRSQRRGSEHRHFFKSKWTPWHDRETPHV